MPDHCFLGLELGRRLTIARLPDGTLWLHSPIKPTAAVVRAIDALGRVAHIIGPNTFHDAFLPEAQTVWRDARFHAAPGLGRTNKKLRIDATLTDTPDASWAGVFSQHVMRGAPAFNEVVFLHRASRSLIIADLSFNLGDNRGIFSRLMFRAYGVQGKFGPSPLLKKLIKDRAAFRASLDHILAWDFDRIIVGHGNNVETGGKDALYAAFAFLR